MSKYTAEAIAATVREHGYCMLMHHSCAFCGVWVRFLFGPDDRVVFDPNCECASSFGGYRISSYQDISDWLGMQSSDDIRDKILSRFS